MLHGVVGFARHYQALERKGKMDMVTPKIRLVNGTRPASIVSFAGHFLALVKKVVGVHMGTG